MNKPIRTLAIFCLLLFVALMVNATYLQYWQSSELGQDPRNRRIIEAAFSRERGAILVGDQAVAESEETDDQYEFQRVYDQPLKYAPMTGYFSFFSQTGLEQTQNPVLSGDDPRLFVRRLVDLLGSEAPQGGSIQLTIDPAAQDAAFEGLRGVGADVEGAVVALEPSSGKILAMVSLPSYDPNRLASHDLQAVEAANRELQRDDAEPLLNRAVGTRLPPGSTFKLVTAAAAIESGSYDAESTVPGGATYQLPLTSGESGLIDNGGRPCGTNRIPFVQAMANSCNTTFAALANEVGAQAMQEQAEAFGFNSDYLEDLEPQARSVFPVGMDEAQTGQSGIGQFEVASTPLQMAMVAAGIANGGAVMQPYLVDEVRTPDLRTVDKTTPIEYSRAVSASTADDITELLVATVDQGTASVAQIPEVEVAGKTGTAQSGVEGRSPYAWFVSFAPADDPQVAVAVMVENAGIPATEVAGGAVAGPIAKAVMEAVILP